MHPFGSRRYLYGMDTQTNTESSVEPDAITPEERAVRKVLGYPEDGAVTIAGTWLETGKTYCREAMAYGTHEDLAASLSWWKLLGTGWVRMLNSVTPDNIYRCVCVECSIRVMYIDMLTPGNELFDDPASKIVVEDAKRVDFCHADGMAGFERAIYQSAGLSLLAEAIAVAAGLRFAKNTSPQTIASRLVEHARRCTLPFPYKITCWPISATKVVGDAS